MNAAIQVCAACALATAAAAQTPLMTYSLGFDEVYAGTNTLVPSPDGVIEPGEGARIKLTTLFSPPVGTPIEYPPPPGPGVGTVAGLGGILFDLAAQPPAPGSWSNLQRAHGFVLGSAGTPVTTPGGPLEVGSISGAQAGQYVDFLTIVLTTNPINSIWRGVWTPESYEPRVQTFRTQPTSPDHHSSILIQYGIDPEGTPLYTGLWIPGQFGSIQIPIVPAPSASWALLLLALPRRRHGHP